MSDDLPNRTPDERLTPEDCQIWAAVAHDAFVLNGMTTLWDNAEIDDRRAFKLMMYAQEMRAAYFKFNPLVAAFDDTDEILCGGSLRDLWADYPHLVPQV